FFDIYNPRRAIEVSQVSSETLQQMVRFVKLGIEHIFTGYDHLAFLLGLILLGGSIRRLIAIVSSFTVAHSVTLTLATLDVVVLPTRFVESAIALSICYIALENIFVREINGRWKITFFFGLIHGFGFSNILRAMQLPRKGLVTSLFSFNAGVEIGQVVIITLLCPLIFFVARHSWHKAVVTVTSALIGGLGLMWFLERMS
ncbi:HupE/UreJ family protein, partial [Acidobacteria bacterium AH-259-L09]|nr:HupE/UreJ family protein [Acidobacteria bacterium AH-259-L09]